MFKKSIIWHTTVAIFILSTHSNSIAATPSKLSPDLFNKLLNVPTLDLVNPRIESSEYKPLGLPILSPTAAQKAAIISKFKSTQNPINKNYPTLEKCQLVGVNIELDNQANTHEYLFTPANNCGRPSKYQSKPFWIIQQIGNQAPKVLVSDEAYQVRIWQKETGSTKRRIETIAKSSAMSRYTQKPVEVRCHSNWNFIGGNYSYRPDYNEVYRSTSSSRGKTWVIVDGQDPFVAIDQNFRCIAQ